MPHSKKIVKSEFTPSPREVRRQEEPASIMQQHPAWTFSRCDSYGTWAFSHAHVQDEFWNSILPRLINLESQTWNDILIQSKKNNHSIPVPSLNKCAIKRLGSLDIDEETIVSLRIDGTHRLYGFLSGATFVLLWYDDDHGDNGTCVCRCKKKYT